MKFSDIAVMQHVDGRRGLQICVAADCKMSLFSCFTQVSENGQMLQWVRRSLLWPFFMMIGILVESSMEIVHITAQTASSSHLPCLLSFHFLHAPSENSGVCDWISSFPSQFHVNGYQNRMKLSRIYPSLLYLGAKILSLYLPDMNFAVDKSLPVWKSILSSSLVFWKLLNLTWNLVSYVNVVQNVSGLS